jgi:hypothetical protein
MKTTRHLLLRPLSHIVLFVAIAALIAACSRAAPAAETRAESPLEQSESPLLQPESPLTAPVSAPVTEEEALALAEITEPAEPGDGMATISGVVYSFGTVPGAVRGTQVYLEAADEVEGKYYPPSVSLGPKVAEGDIIVETNTLGQLQMEIEPGNYYAAVWSLYDWKLVNTEANDQTPRLITLEEGDQINLGVLYVYWP